MGALAPVVSPWIPEDDLLLKNAIEAGASLESLAKGAVQFSRKFTVRELQDRWHSLLYDPVVSDEASSRMIDFERSASTLPSKSSRTGNTKDNKSLPEKRKSESVRSCYSALRKRIRNEPFNPIDLSFLIAPNDGNYGIQDEPLPGNCMLGIPIADHFGVQETNMDIMHCSFPELLADDGAATRDGCTTDDFQATIQKQDDDGCPSEPVNIHKEGTHILEEDQFLVENGSGIEELHQPKELPVHSLFEANDLILKSSSTFDQMNNNPETICSEFEGNQVFNSPIVECGMSIWRSDEGLSASAIPAGDGHGETDLHEGNIYPLPGDNVAQCNHASGNDVVGADSKFESEIPCMELENQTANTEGYLVEITNTLMNDEPFFMDDNAKDVIDKSYFDGLSSLLASSPTNDGQDQMPDVIDVVTSETPDNLATVSCSYLGELDKVAGSCTVDGPESCNSDVLMLSSASTSASQFPELTNGIICCMLNTEDPEIPCNDDIVFPEQVLSSTRQSFKEGSNQLSASVKDFSGGQKTSEGSALLVQRDKRDTGQSDGVSQMKGSQVMPEMGQLHPVSKCRVKCEDSPCVAPRSDGFLANGSAQIDARNAGEGTLPSTLPKEKSEEIMGKPLNHGSADSFIEKPTPCSVGHNSVPPVNSSSIKQGVDAAETKDKQALSADVVSLNVISPEPVVDHPPPDLEETPVEGDEGVPYFSDIEAMILDMDLDPDDQDLCDQEVLRYQHEDTKRAIIRLEQSFNSYMQRAIASHGAFAILYGRHSKHYIKKPE
ncbi:hypothetical protein CCACVL1_09001, partial [Corchorus capsularis]